MVIRRTSSPPFFVRLIASSCRSLLSRRALHSRVLFDLQSFGINSQSFASEGSVLLHSLQHLQAGLFEDSRCFGKLKPPVQPLNICVSWMPACFFQSQPGRACLNLPKPLITRAFFPCTQDKPQADFDVFFSFVTVRPGFSNAFNTRRIVGSVRLGRVTVCRCVFRRPVGQV
jgi:hypothetical protein